MVDLVLDDLSCPAGEGFDAGLEFLILPLDFDGFVAFTGTGVTQKG
jgi:hypothetical protein